VAVRDLSKAFAVQRGWRELLRHPFARESQTVLQRVTFEVQRGEFFGLLGENGAGKSTLFRILSGLVTADTGAVLVNGVSVSDAPREARHELVPVLTNDRSLHWRLSAADNLALFAVLHGLSGAQQTARVRDVLETVGLQDVRGKQVGLFSSGMRQRLLIARALLTRPAILLLDEPTRSLDPVSAREFRAFLREEIGGRQGCTVLLATHDQDEVRDLCDRIAVLHRGELLVTGETEAVFLQHEVQRVRVRMREALSESCKRVLAGAAMAVEREGAPEADGWRWHVIRLPDSDEPAALFALLARHGGEVARLEREPFGLAELLDAVSRSRRTGPSHA
jgi:ABC-2 type transport system ATP-binding protein